MVQTSVQRARSTERATTSSTNPNSHKPSSYVEGQSYMRNFWYVEDIPSNGPHLVRGILGILDEIFMFLVETAVFGALNHREGIQNGPRDVRRGWDWNIEKKFFWKRPDLGQKWPFYVSEVGKKWKGGSCTMYIVHIHIKSDSILFVLWSYCYLM